MAAKRKKKGRSTKHSRKAATTDKPEKAKRNCCQMPVARPRSFEPRVNNDGLQSLAQIGALLSPFLIGGPASQLLGILGS